MIQLAVMGNNTEGVQKGYKNKKGGLKMVFFSPAGNCGDYKSRDSDSGKLRECSGLRFHLCGSRQHEEERCPEGLLIKLVYITASTGACAKGYSTYIKKRTC
jgi:hypothetical protein